MTSKWLKEREVQTIKQMAEYRRWQQTQPCKNEQPLCRTDGGCLRCDADAGEVCQDRERPHD